MKRIVAVIDFDNKRSIRTAENLGLKYEKDVIFNGIKRQLYSINL